MLFRSIAIAVLIQLPLFGQAALAQSVALILGVSQSSPLMPEAVAVSRSVRRELEGAGYVIFGGDNLNRQDMHAAIALFEAEAYEADRAVVFLSGRMASKGAASWLRVPTGSARTASDLAREALSLETVLTPLADLGGKSVVFVNDGVGQVDGKFGLKDGLGEITPRAGQLVLRGRAEQLANVLFAGLQAGAALRDVAIPRSVTVIGSIAPELQLHVPSRQIAADERSAWGIATAVDNAAGYRAYLQQFPNGAFAAIARQKLAEPEAPQLNPGEAEEKALKLSRSARRDVQRKLTILGFDTRGVDGIFGRGSRGAIRGFQRDSGFEPTGYLTRPIMRELERQATRRAEEIAEEKRQAKAAREAEDYEFWRTTGASGRPDDLRAYLKRYPNGLFAGEARKEMARQGISGGDDDADWRRAYDQDTIASYEAYLAAQPRGKYRRDAETRMRVLKVNGIKSPTKPAIDPATAEKALGLSQVDRATLELRLGSIGFNTGFPEGRLDQRARKAIAQFQGKQGIKATGYFDRATVDRILKLSRQ